MFADISHERQQSLLRQRNLFALSSAGLAVALTVVASLAATRDREVVLLPTLPKQLTVSSAGVEADYLELVTRDTALVLLNLSGEGSVAPFRRPSLPLQTSDFFNFFNSIGRKRFDRFDAFSGIQSLSLRPLVSHVRWPGAANPRARPLNKWTRLSTYTGIMTRPMRKDAAQRRDALQKAAAVEFTERGLNVPLDAIADRAGVGRATLYRNFADRGELVFAVFAGLVDELAERMRQNTGPEAFFEFVHELAELLLRNVALSAALRDPRSRGALVQLQRKMIAAGTTALSLSQRAGKVRRDLGAEDIHVIAALLGAGLETAHPSERETISRRTRVLVLEGLASRP